MNDVVEFLATMPFWYWWVLAVCLLLVEIATGTTYFLWPSAAALVVGFSDIWPLDGAWRLQFALFATVTVALMAFGTPRAKRWINASRSDHLTLNERGEQKIGKRALVEDDFANGTGRVKFGDTVWMAESVDGGDFAKGVAVEITGSEGAKLFVKSAANSVQ